MTNTEIGLTVTLILLLSVILLALLLAFCVFRYCGSYLDRKVESMQRLLEEPRIMDQHKLGNAGGMEEVVQCRLGNADGVGDPLLQASGGSSITVEEMRIRRLGRFSTNKEGNINPRSGLSSSKIVTLDSLVQDKAA
ncbi:hypothetical protein [Ehrlichia canis]|uniref:Uncharacterized protein n=1 Tax=Ehrlichia canis (strain Jake) TaxID=269484 RepID=A0ACA6AWS6_EHRCJ|nr:hypothetical protein [Ehrlichia canis]AAZ68756.1 hypothetical protein Ecaj_0724 [Ehrlichia canis str. Jake]